MNKIVSRDWMHSFGSIEQQVIHTSERYFEVVTKVAESHLASAVSRTIGMPGLTIDNVILKPENKLTLRDFTESEHMRSLFVLSGHVNSTFDFGNNEAESVVQKQKHAFQYSTPHEAEHRILADHLHAFSIETSPTFLKSLMGATTGEMDDVINCFTKQQSFHSISMLQPRMVEIINYIVDCPFKGVTRYLFIESKVLELLALQMEQIKTPGVDGQAISNSDVEKLWAVKTFIENNYLEPLSLASLCKIFSLNEFKLKKGYKKLFHTTVFGHINSLRMDKARQLLSQKQLTVSEVADFIGYKSIGSFSVEFKKRFGYAPSRLY
jgi:AraC-like DNA-binding protein